MSKITHLITPEMKESETINVVLFATGEWTKNDKDDKWVMQVKEQNLSNIESIKTAVYAAFNKKLEVTIIPYSDLMEFNRPDQGTLLVTVPADSTDKARYQMNDNYGTLGEVTK